jgi:hypothetical protein
MGSVAIPTGHVPPTIPKISISDANVRAARPTSPAKLQMTAGTGTKRVVIPITSAGQFVGRRLGHRRSQLSDFKLNIESLGDFRKVIERAKPMH